MQEISVAVAEPMVYCGKKRAPWSNFAEFLDIGFHLAVQSPERLSMIPKEADKAFCMDMLRQDMLRLSPLEKLIVYTLLSSSIGRFNCSEPRDKVYAMIGMARHNDKIKLIPDYSKPVAEVYADAVRHVIREDCNVNILCLAAGKREWPDLPTWAIDFSVSKENHFSILRNQFDFYAAGNSRACVGPAGNPNELCVGGFKVDTIDSVFLPQSNIAFKSGMDKLQDLCRILKSLECAALESLTRIFSSATDARRRLHDNGALWRTLVPNSNIMHLAGPTGPAPQRIGTIFEAMLGQSKLRLEDMDISVSPLPCIDMSHSPLNPFVANWLPVFGDDSSHRCFFCHAKRQYWGRAAWIGERRRGRCF